MKLACLLFTITSFGFAADLRVAITIDDLPRGGDGPREFALIRPMTEKLLRPFREQHIPVIGFVNEGRRGSLTEKQLRQILDLWLNAGADLGNHANTHPDLNNVPLDQYTADITKGEPITRAALAARGKKLKYFRHPYLHAGATPESKKGLADFLASHSYTVAPVTIDDADYDFAAAYLKPGMHDRVLNAYVPYMESVVEFFEKRGPEVAGHDFPQILLIHANQLNADTMPELLAMFRKRGYRFVTLDEALADPAYQLPEDYVGKGGFSWVHRWSRFKGMPPKGEPDAPKWVTGLEGQ